MATASANTEKKSNGSFDIPKRGQVKAQMFDSLAKTLVSAASKVGKALGGAAGSGGNSAATTPPPSAYNSDGNSDIS
jgi:hypothetical protein